MGVRKRNRAEILKEARQNTYFAKLNKCPTSTRKMRFVADMIRGTGVESALHIVKRGGIVILIAECSKGYGDQVFYDWSVKFNNHKDMTKHLKKRFMVEGFTAYCLKRALHKAKLFLVSIMPFVISKLLFKVDSCPNKLCTCKK